MKNIFYAGTNFIIGFVVGYVLEGLGGNDGVGLGIFLGVIFVLIDFRGNL